jgi:hypothetical protein
MKISKVQPNQEFRFPKRGPRDQAIVYNKLQAASETISGYKYLYSKSGTVYGTSYDEDVTLVDKDGKDIPPPKIQVKLTLNKVGQSPLFMDIYQFNPDVTEQDINSWAKLTAQHYKWDSATWEYV